MELHAVEFLEKIVGKLDIRLVDFIDQQHRADVHRECVPELPATNIVSDVTHPRITELAVAQPADGVILVKALMRLCCGFDVPLDEWHAQRLCHLDGENGFARAGLSLDEQRPGQGYSSIHRYLEILGRDVGRAALKAHQITGLDGASRGALDETSKST